MRSELEPSTEMLLTNCLADAAQRGEIEEFEALYARVSPGLYVWADLRVPSWARRHLSPEERRRFLARALEQRSHEEIARDLGVSLAAAKKKWQRLRGRLEEDGVLQALGA